MNKLQIQLPTSLYKQLKLLAERLDYSMAELMRRGAEQLILNYPQHGINSEEKAWSLPKAKPLGLKIRDPRRLKEIAYERDLD